MEPMELKVLRRQTEAFIAENPTSIVMKRSVRTPNGKGGYTIVVTDQASQVFRIIPQQRSGHLSSRGIDGTVIKPEYVLIGKWDANVNNNDTFTFGGREYLVDHVQDVGMPATYEKRVEVVFNG